MCKGRSRVVRRYLDTGDRSSTSNMRKHAKLCWGEGTVAAACNGGDATDARRGIQAAKQETDGSITAVFERTGKGKVSYSHRQHTKTQTR
jgi:hypothetical protein